MREGGGYIWRGVTALSLNMFTGEGGEVIFGGSTTALSLNMFTGEGGGRLYLEGSYRFIPQYVHW